MPMQSKNIANLVEDLLALYLGAESEFKFNNNNNM